MILHTASDHNLLILCVPQLVSFGLRLVAEKNGRGKARIKLRKGTGWKGIPANGTKGAKMRQVSSAMVTGVVGVV